MTAKTNTFDYWFNWRFLICAIGVFSAMVIATILIWKYEGSDAGEERAEVHEEAAGTLYGDESWRPCLKEIHPAWLLAFRVIAFFVLTTLLVINVAVQGSEMFYFYTQWTFALVAIYFGVGSLLSIYGCGKLLNKVDCNTLSQLRLDAEQGTYVAPTSSEYTNTLHRMKRYGSQEEHYIRPVAGFWGYAFQIIYQMNAGAVMLTDCVFWLIIVPFLTMKDYHLNFFMIGMHSVNAIFLLGDTALNSLRFPWFRISYFLLWTAVYVIFQWAIHACIPIWWPYPFLDLSSSYAPLWYFSVAVMHIPCYAVFAGIIKMKHLILSRCFPQSYVCLSHMLVEASASVHEALAIISLLRILWDILATGWPHFSRRFSASGSRGGHWCQTHEVLNYLGKVIVPSIKFLHAITTDPDALGHFIAYKIQGSIL